MTLFPTTSPGTSVPSFLSLLDCLLYPDEVTLQAGRIYSMPSRSPHLAHQTQHLPEGHFLSVPAKRQRRGWTEAVLAEANKYIKFPAGSGDKGSERGG